MGLARDTKVSIKKIVCEVREPLLVEAEHMLLCLIRHHPIDVCDWLEMSPLHACCMSMLEAE
jgi:hypothetical protein